MNKRFHSVFKARSGAVFRAGSGFVFTLNADRDPGYVIRHWTAWVDRGLDHPVPSHLLLEVRGSDSAGIDDVRPRLESVARHSAMLLAFVANTAIEPPITEITFDASPGIAVRDFRQSFVTDPEAWPLMGGRLFQDEELAAFFELYFGSHPPDRVRRALHQYALALRQWRFGTEYQSLQHLWIAAENLRNLFRDRRTPKSQREEYAQLVGISTKHKGWLNDLDALVMREDVFGSDDVVYKAAKRASDELEHGFGDMSSIQALAMDHGHAAFMHLRSALLRLIDPSSELPPELASRLPLDIDSRRKVIHGELVSEQPVDAVSLGGEKWEFPHLHWRSRLSEFHETDDGYSFGYSEKMTVRTSDDVFFRGTAIAMLGRLQPGEEKRTQQISPPGGIGDSVDDLSDLCDFMDRMHRAAGHATDRVQVQSREDVQLLGSLTNLIGLYEVVLLLLRRSRWIEAAPIASQLIEASVRLVHAGREDSLPDLLTGSWTSALQADALADQLRDSISGEEDAAAAQASTQLMNEYLRTNANASIEEFRHLAQAIDFDEAFWPWLLGRILSAASTSVVSRWLGADGGFSTVRADFENEQYIGLGATKALMLARSLVASRLDLAHDLQHELLESWMNEVVEKAYRRQGPSKC